MTERTQNIATFIFYLALMCAVIFALAGCKTTPVYRETRIIDTVLSVAPPAIHDTLRAVDYDTVVVAERINGRDTVIKVRYYPKTNTVTVYAKPDTVRLKYRDTTVVYKEAAKEESSVWPWLIVIVIFGIVGLYMYIMREKA